MIQNSAYGNPMLDGASAFPDIYIQHQSADKPEGPPPSNNNIANYTNRNSGYPYQTCVASAPAPLVARESCVRAEFVKDTQDLAVGFRQLSHNVPIKTEHCIANNVATNETGGELGITTARPKASEQMLQTVDQKPYESFTQQSIAYVQTPAAAGEEREREEEQDVGAKASPKKEQRRPMNAFLIFCKRHRTMLKNRFPEENRAISIKLGKWWRMLTTEQKKPFQLLSKEVRTY
uniref:HMG box domain-containing protein n=1 Tax=Anopheles merus TaxID=30066 RepID=A0A182VCU1_ANOME